ncbi:MAG: alginate export family protein [Acidobacteriaceae bacterium]|nr:alginate export family protein [Acidobacteriaceae bacterium]
MLKPGHGILLRAGGRLLLPLLLAGFANAQEDPLQDFNQKIREATHNQFGLTFEERTRWEERYGVNFGKAVNQQDMLSRIRIGAQYDPTDWFRISAMGQDSRAPFYGAPAPNSIRDTMDLHEAYLEFFAKRTLGFGATVGREMLDYGESRVIGTPQWGNLARTYDNARVYYRAAKARYEVLMVSPVKILPDSFNKPELGERIWGTYDTWRDVWHGVSVDGYALRHSQNKIGGYTGAGTLGTNTFGSRVYGPLPWKFAYSLEGIVQGGHIGLSTQRAFAWFAGASRTVDVWRRPLLFSAEYKVASGNKGTTATGGTYDQLSPANHDKFGHMDLFGWRNLKTFKSLETWRVTNRLAWNVMYTNHWLYSATDSLYNSSGSSITVSKKGTAGTHVGQELDSFVTCKLGSHTVGAGFGHFFKGEFVTATTPNINPRYFYVFQQYSFK